MPVRTILERFGVYNIRHRVRMRYRTILERNRVRDQRKHIKLQRAGQLL